MGQHSKGKAIPKHRPANNAANKKAQSKSQAKSKKKSIQISKQQRGALWVVVLKFESIFCWTLPGFLAGWILCWPMLWDGFSHGFLADRKNNFPKAAPKNIFSNSGQNKNFIFSQID